MTSDTFAPYTNCEMANLQLIKELHKTSHFNKDIMPGDPHVYTPRVHNIVPQWDHAIGVDPLRKVLTWCDSELGSYPGQVMQCQGS